VKKNIVLFLAFWALSFTTYGAEKAQEFEEPILNVSLIKLIMNPENYLGHYVQVFGYANSFESALYLTKDHAEMRDHMSSIDIRDNTDAGYLSIPCFNGWKYIQAKVEVRSGGEFFRLGPVVLIREPDGKVCWEASPESLLEEIAKSSFLQGDYSKVSTLLKTADGGDPYAQYLIAQAYFEGKGVERDLQLAKEYFLESANNGYADAQYVCAMNHLSGVNGFEKSDSKAVKLLLSSAEMGFLHSICALSKMNTDKIESGKWKVMSEELNACE
jgi:TPR repeat protein